MHRRINVFDPFPEAFEVDHSSVANNTSMSQQSSFNDILHPVEGRLSNNVVSPEDTTCMNPVSHEVHGFYGWSSGESSSRFSSRMRDDEIKMEGIWPPGDVMVGSRSDIGQFETASNIYRERVNIGANGNQLRSRPPFLRGSSSNYATLNLDTAERYATDGDNRGQSSADVLSRDHVVDAVQESSVFNYPDAPGTSSGIPDNLFEETSGSGSTLGGWGSSCKRKALEGTSGHSCPGGSSSCIPPAGNDGLQMGGVPHNASTSFSFPTPLQNSPGPSDVDLLRNFGRRVHPSQQESTALNLSNGVGRSSGPWFPRRQLPSTDSPDLRSAASRSNTSISQSQPHTIDTSSSSRNRNRLPWSRTSDARAGSSSGWFIPFERGVTSPVEGDLRSMQRNSANHSLYVPLPEMRNTAQEPIAWDSGTGTASSSGVTSTRMVPSSSVHPIPSSSWTPQRQQTSVNQHRFSEFSPWSLFPQLESEPGGRGAHFLPLSSGSYSSSREASVSSGSSSHDRNQAFLRSTMMDDQNDDVLGLPRSMRALATDFEGRHRLISEIRHVLTAMRRGENLRIEDYLLFDPFGHHGMGEMHDRHRDMRLDVDNMSYEELLALEEQIGVVNTGLSEETILKVMKQQQYTSARTASSDDQEPCCICQEKHLDGDNLGVLDCGHEFHTNCIKQWLTVKNICPICKTTALPT